MEMAAWEIEHPCPTNLASVISSSSTLSWRRISSPHTGLAMWTSTVRSGSSALFFGLR